MPGKFTHFLRKILRLQPRKVTTQTAPMVVTETDFLCVWRKHVLACGLSQERLKHLVKDVFGELKEHLKRKRLQPEEVANAAVLFAAECKQRCNDEKRTHQILLAVAEILATYKVDDRALARRVLTMLFAISKCIDREILFFDQASQTKPVRMHDKLLAKQVYMLEQAAGWIVEGAPWNTGIPNNYLELPFRRASSSANSNIMAEALYRQQDPALVLRLLQHGLAPSCLYLWPTCILIDLKFTLSHNDDAETAQQAAERKMAGIRDSNEAVMLRYFCRARHYIHVHAVKTEERSESMANLPSRIGYDDILLVPPKAIGIIPEDRFRFPSSLQHQCRLRIRKEIQAADKLPRGLDALPLPKSILSYLQLWMD